MKTSILELQGAIFNVLKNDKELMKKVKGVYDYVDEDMKMPVVTIGETYVNDYSTASFNGEDLTQDIHIWSKYKGKKECKEIINLVLIALFDNLKELGGGFEIDIMKRENIEIFDDPDGETKHGVIRLKFMVREI